ncbi:MULTISPECIES: SIS domain-containing protein [Terrabacteria group]|uniref:SIS domain-containing protein n=1 Tax=Bacillati TaxID=1783272 RepID=UPI001C6E66B0|nr:MULTISPECIES: SIS domain-containing protein [Terrabacteria group]MBW9212912.1 SIS domain-containing protein [Trueperella sp. zg.1013]
MFSYFDKIYELLEIVKHQEKDNMIKVASIMSENIMNNKSIFIFGASHAGILTQELFYRAGGLITINPIFAKEVMLDISPITSTSKMERLEGYGTIIGENVEFKKGDLLIVHSVSGRNPVAIDLALYAKSKGVIIACITNKKYSLSTLSRHSSKLRMLEILDVVIDNHGDIGDASCSIDGYKQKIAPTSTVVGASILNEIVVQVCNNLSEKNVSPLPIFYSANLDGGDKLNEELFKKYKSTIHYKL